MGLEAHDDESTEEVDAEGETPGKTVAVARLRKENRQLKERIVKMAKETTETTSALLAAQSSLQNKVSTKQEEAAAMKCEIQVAADKIKAMEAFESSLDVSLQKARRESEEAIKTAEEVESGARGQLEEITKRHEEVVARMEREMEERVKKKEEECNQFVEEMVKEKEEECKQYLEEMDNDCRIALGEKDKECQEKIDELEAVLIAAKLAVAQNETDKGVALHRVSMMKRQSLGTPGT